MNATTENSICIAASPEDLFRAFTDPLLIEAWLAPGEMTAKIHNFDLRVGGGYRMSLYYPPTGNSGGKTSEKEDRFTAKFIELTPYRRITEAISFDSADPAFSGEMIMDVTFEAKDKETWVTIMFSNIPAGIRPEDNEAGTRSSLGKLARILQT